MELWIRSQDKETLSKIINLKIEGRQILGNTKCDDWYVYLGTYKRKQRALEVLDDIQRYLILPNPDNSNYVYEMPKE